MNLKNILPVWGVLVLFFAASGGSVFAFSSGPPDEKTGAPNEGTVHKQDAMPVMTSMFQVVH